MPSFTFFKLLLLLFIIQTWMPPHMTYITFQIKVSVSSGGDCLRSYRPDIRKGRYNTIILHVKTTTPDNLLFYLGSAKYVSMPLYSIHSTNITLKDHLKKNSYIVFFSLPLGQNVSISNVSFSKVRINWNVSCKICFLAHVQQRPWNYVLLYTNICYV